jgi:hypothetical protein
MTKICGARYLITDSYESAAGFYGKYGFQLIEGGVPGSTVKMFLDLKVARSALDLKRKAAANN